MTSDTQTSPRPRHPQEERGAAAVLVAASLIMLMGIAAVAIDLGAGFNERRQAQSGADFAALAALQFAQCAADPADINCAVDTGAVEALAVANANLPDQAFTNTDWATCSDPGALARVSTVSPCISFTNNLERARVVIPEATVDTSFGRVIGAASLSVSAPAIAGQQVTASSELLPNTPLSSSGAESCLFSNQAPQTVPPCDGPASGFYGYLDVALYGNSATGTPSTCDNGDSNTRIALNLAAGSDHNLVEWAPGDPAVNDHDVCPNRSEDINEMVVQTGSPTGGITDGLILGVSGSINGEPIPSLPGRLICGPSSVACQTVRVHNLDHTGLWEFLLPGVCPGTDTHDEMKTCLEGWSGGVIFDEAIGEHPRFAAVPVFTVTPTGPGSYLIDRFIPVWLETLDFECNANFCDTVHSPGETTSLPSCPNPIDPAINNCGWGDTSGSDDVEGLTAFEIDLGMLPDSITEHFPGTLEARTRWLVE